MRRNLMLALLWAGSLGGVYEWAHRAPPNAPPLVMERAVSSTGVSADEVRAILRQELEALKPAPTAPGAVQAASAPEAVVARAAPTVPPASTEAAERALALVDARIDTGTWSEEDRRRLQAEAAHLTNDQLAGVLSKLFPAAQDGRLKLTYEGSPL
jgi:hypothetical protein